MFYHLLCSLNMYPIYCTNSFQSLYNIKKAELEARIIERKNTSYYYTYVSERNISTILDVINDIQINQNKLKKDTVIGLCKPSFCMLILQCNSIIRKSEKILNDIQDLKYTETTYKRSRLNIEYLNNIIEYLIIMLTRSITVYTKLFDIIIQSRLINNSIIKISLIRCRNMLKTVLNEHITKLRFLSENYLVKELLYTDYNLDIRDLIIMTNCLCIRAVENIEISEQDD